MKICRLILESFLFWCNLVLGAAGDSLGRILKDTAARSACVNAF